MQPRALRDPEAEMWTWDVRQWRGWVAECRRPDPGLSGDAASVCRLAPCQGHEFHRLLHTLHMHVWTCLPPPPHPFRPAYSIPWSGATPQWPLPCALVSGAPPKDALHCGVHYLWFAFVCFLIRSHPPPPLHCLNKHLTLRRTLMSAAL